MKLILASASARRAEILRAAGIPFEALATGADETLRSGEAVEAMVLRLAEAKARAAIASLKPPHETAIVIGADTVVDLDGEVLGKPGSARVAAEMLRKLSGRTHRVVTGLAVIRVPDGAARLELETTQVRFAPLTAEEIDRYAATGEPLDKAGAYAIQGIAGRYVERIEGCYFNVVGLPLARLCRILKDLGWQPDEPGLERQRPDPSAGNEQGGPKAAHEILVDFRTASPLLIFSRLQL
jgi:septum formation protein